MIMEAKAIYKLNNVVQYKWSFIFMSYSYLQQFCNNLFTASHFPTNLLSMITLQDNKGRHRSNFKQWRKISSSIDVNFDKSNSQLLWFLMNEGSDVLAWSTPVSIEVYESDSSVLFYEVVDFGDVGCFNFWHWFLLNSFNY